jgi:hypothetical protein
LVSQRSIEGFVSLFGRAWIYSGCVMCIVVQTDMAGPMKDMETEVWRELYKVCVYFSNN